MKDTLTIYQLKNILSDVLVDDPVAMVTIMRMVARRINAPVIKKPYKETSVGASMKDMWTDSLEVDAIRKDEEDIFNEQGEYTYPEGYMMRVQEDAKMSEQGKIKKPDSTIDMKVFFES